MKLISYVVIVACAPAVFLTAACEPGKSYVDPTLGTLGKACKSDGTCAGENLTCQRTYETTPFSDDWQCMPRPVATGQFHYESERFCITCADKCGDAGVKTCAYSDTSVWGAKPALCECK